MIVRALLLSALPAVLPLALLGGVEAPAVPGPGWLPVPAQSLAVAPGSALDFSGLVAPQEAGGHGAVKVAAGALRFADGAPPRFNCGLLANGPNGTWAYPTHADADALADQLRLHGYNLIRFHFVDARLMNHTVGDLAIDPVQLDRFQYLLAALKHRGIYWMLDMLTAPNGGPRVNQWPAKGADTLKIRVNFDPAAQQRWLAQVDAIYARSNPYTGISPLADPALAFVVGANENSIAFTSGNAFPKGFGTLFDRWVRETYPQPQALAAALPDLSAAERAGTAPIALPAGWAATGPRGGLLRHFVSDVEVGAYRWMSGQLATRGYHGPVLNFPEWYAGLDGATRARLPITDIHAYVGEVTSYAPGTQLKLPSSTSDAGLGAWTTNAGGRWLDRPLVASEFGFPIPNPYRYEGTLFPALAAFQGYSAICRMASMPVEPAIPAPGPGATPLLGYSVGLDPVGRATETISTLLFFRGDMARGTGTVAVPFGPDEFARPGSAFLPGPLRRAALLDRFGLVPPDGTNRLRDPKLVVPVTPGAYTGFEKAAAWIEDLATGQSTQQTTALSTNLKRLGLLPAGNATAPASGVYQSQTGQLTIDQSAGTIRIVTPRTEAFTSTGATQAATLGRLSIRSTDTGALVAAAALDAQPLARSRRILFVLTGDAVNSGLKLGGTGIARTLVDWGKLPILLQHVTAQVSLAAPGYRRGRLSVLSLAGAPVAARPVAAQPDGSFALTLDTGAVAASPTTYFLFEAQ